MEGKAAEVTVPKVDNTGGLIMADKQNPNAKPQPYPDERSAKEQAENLAAHERSIAKVERLAQEGQKR